MAYISVAGFAKAIGKGYRTIQAYIVEGSPIGVAYKHGKKYSYDIYPEKVRELFGTEILEKAIEYSKFE